MELCATAEIGLPVALVTCSFDRPVAKLPIVSEVTFRPTASGAAPGTCVDMALPQVDAFLMTPGGPFGLVGLALGLVDELVEIAHGNDSFVLASPSGMSMTSSSAAAVRTS